MWAVPARPSFFKVTQPDGSELVIKTFGDEHFHGLMTEDGTIVRLNAKTGWYEAVDAATLNEQLLCAREKKQQINQVRAERLSSMRRAQQAWGDTPHEIGDRCPREGNKKGLVILVNFKNKTFRTSTKTMYDMFNKKDYSGNGHIGSVKDYFLDQSYGKLNIDFDVVGPVTVSKDYSYYGKNSSTSGSDANVYDMVAEACKLVNDSVDFSKYDWDGDNEVDQVYLIYAGYGENASTDANTIWPHEYTLSYAGYYSGKGALTMDGVKVDTYACSCELAGSSGSTTNGIGTACHEFSHCLGFPDIYDTDYAGCPTMGDWDVMDGGSYSGPNNNGEIPCGMSAYERWMGGWLEFTELKDPMIISSMPNLIDSACAYIIYNERERCEAYILENRQNTRWFTYPQGAHGMLITHVDYDSYAWMSNNVNKDANHPRMIYVPANNTYGQLTDYGGQKYYQVTTTTLRGQLWPGTSKKTALTNSSTPAATLYNANSDGKKFLNAPIEKISEKNGKIGFYFKGGIMLDKPVLSLESEPYSATLSWSEVEGATAYEVKMIAVPREEIIGFHLGETMEKLTATSDATTDLSSKLDAYMDHTGWKGVKVYKGKYGAKLGSSSTSGALRTPLMTLDGDLKVKMVLTPFSNTENTVSVILKDSALNEIDNVTVTATGSVDSLSLKTPKGKYYVQIASTKRIYVGSIELTETAGTIESVVKVQNATSYTFPTLEENMSYTFQVRAISDYAQSLWSDGQIVLTETAIETIEMNQPILHATRHDLFGRKVLEDKHTFQIINNHLIYQK